MLSRLRRLPYKYVVAIVFIFGLFMDLLDTTAVNLAPITGPVLGGYLVQSASWRWIFYINLPVGVIGFVLGLRVLREHKEPYAQGRFDVLGLLTGGAGAAMLLYALSEAANSSLT